MTPEDFARICEWDAKITWPENTMFGTTIDRRRLIEYVKEMQAESAGCKQQLALAPTYEKMIAHHGVQEARIQHLESALTLLTNGFKYSTEVVTIARDALGAK
jgi:hypothetical protein